MFLKMEDDLNNFFKRKTTSILFEKGRRPQKNNATKTIKSRNNNIFENGRRPQFNKKGRRPKVF